MMNVQVFTIILSEFNVIFNSVRFYQQLLLLLNLKSNWFLKESK